MYTGIIILLLVLVFPASVAIYRYFFLKEKEEDISGADEDGQFTRYPGSYIEYYRYENDTHRILASDPELNVNGEAYFDFFEINGKRKTVIYKIPLTQNPSIVYDYYLKEFKSSGFDIICSVQGEECMGRPRTWFNKLYLTEKNRTTWMDLAMVMNGVIHCYISGKKTNRNAETYASLFSVNHYRNSKNTGVFVFITEQ